MRKIGLFLKVTHKCNLRCTYCYDHKTISEKHSMDISTFKELIDKAVIDHDFIDVMFHGGEPLVLGMDWYKQALAHCHSKKKNFTFSMQSNSMLLTQEWIDFLKQHQISYGISYDGLETESYRRIPKERILEKAELLAGNGISVGFCTVCNNQFLDNIIAEYEHIKKHAEHARFNYLFGDIPDSYYEIYINRMKQLFDHWIVDQNAITITEMTMPLELMTSQPNYGYACMKCHTGWIGVDYDGLLGLCDFGVIPRDYNMGYLSEYSNLSLAKVSELKINHIKQISQRNLKCYENKCELAGKCTGGCNAKRFYHPSSSGVDFYCMIIKELYNHAKTIVGGLEDHQLNPIAKQILGRTPC